MKKQLAAILATLTIFTAGGALLCATGCEKAPDQGQEEVQKQEAEAVSDLAVTTKGIASFTHKDGFEYQFVADGENVSVNGTNGQYDISSLIDGTKTHTIAVKSKENDTYKESPLSNVINVKAADVNSLDFKITGDKKASFNAASGTTYYLSVNGKETEVINGQDVSQLISSDGVSLIVKLIVKGSVAGDTVTLDGVAPNAYTFSWHKKLADVKIENGEITFTAEAGYTYDLYADGVKIKENVKSGDDISALFDKTKKQQAFYVQVNANVEKQAFVKEENAQSNEVILKFLSAPQISVSGKNGKVFLHIVDTENAGVVGLKYALYAGGGYSGEVTDGQDISEIIGENDEVQVSVTAVADGYVESARSEEVAAKLPKTLKIEQAEVFKNDAGTYIGMYLRVTPLKQNAIPAADWVAMGGTYQGKISLNGTEYNGLVLKITADNCLFLDTECVDSLIKTAIKLRTPLYFEIPAGSTFTYGDGEWSTDEKITICSAYSEAGEISWQPCEHADHTEKIPTNVYTFGAKVERQNGCYDFEIHLKDANGNNAALPQQKSVAFNGTVLLNGSPMQNATFETSDWDGNSNGNYLLIFKTYDGRIFSSVEEYEAAKAAKTVYVVTVKAGAKLTIENKEYLILDDVSYKLSDIGGEYKWRAEENFAAAKISSNQGTVATSVSFEFIDGQNGFEKDDWDVFLSVPAGATYNEEALLIKRAGGGLTFYIDNLTGKTVQTGDTITFKAGSYYNSDTMKGITLDKDYVLVWNGSAWALQA